MKSCNTPSGCYTNYGGVIGTRPSRSLLVQSDEFTRQFSHLLADRSTGRYAGEPITPPDEFNGRAVWKNFLPPIRDQGMCGACWAFAAVDCLASRISIATYGRHRLVLSPAGMVYCNLGGDTEYAMAMDKVNKGLPYDFTMPTERAAQKVRERESVAAVGCQGETLIGAWQYLYRFGATEDQCVPYSGGYKTAIGTDNTDLRNFSSDAPELPACSDILGDSYDICPTTGKPAPRHRAGGYYYVAGAPAVKDRHGGILQAQSEEAAEAELNVQDVGPSYENGTEADIRREIFHWGPVTSGFTVRPDFLQWDGSGVYSWDGSSSSPEDGGHAIVIVGWGNYKDASSGTVTPYWLVRNSWGADWGPDGGYFKIRRGTNECEIEENVVVGFPSLYGYRLYLDKPVLFREHDLALRSVWNLSLGGMKITTIEMMLDGRLPPDAADVDATQYDTDFWPNLATFLAGKPWQNEYLLQRSPWMTIIKPRNLREREKRKHLAMGLVAGIIVAGAVGYVVFGKKK